MWHKFKKVDDELPELPVIEHHERSIRCGSFRICEGAIDNGNVMVPMVGILPSGQIIVDVRRPECDPHFVITLQDARVDHVGDLITDGKKYAWIYNRNDYSNFHYAGHRCRLVEGSHDLTTYDARIIKVIIETYLRTGGSTTP